MNTDPSAKENAGGFADPSRSVGSYPMWKRGFAVMWVLMLCLVSAFVGLLAASVVGDVSGFSGY